MNEFYIRPIEENDLELILNWRNSDRIRTNMYHDHMITMEEHRAWYHRMSQGKRDLYFLFKHQTTPLGLVYFTAIDKANNKCDWGFYIGEENAPRGTGMMMGFLGLTHMFEKYRIRKISGEALAYNTASIHFHKKLGFSEEGILRQHVLKNGRYEDVHCFALLREEWLQNKNNLKQAVMRKRVGLS